MRTMFVAAVVFSAPMLYAQSTPPQTPPAGAQAQTGAGTAAAQRPGLTPPQRLRNMQQQLQQMRAVLARMRTEVAGLQDPKDKQLAQDNVEMWEMMLNHMQDEMTAALHRQMGMPTEHGPHGMRNPAAPPSTTPPPK